MQKGTGALIMLCLIVSQWGCNSTSSTMEENEALEPFAASYERIENRSAIGQKYKLLIVESSHYSKAETNSFRTPANQVLAYISLGEVSRGRWYYPLLEERGFLGINENWDSPYLNLADSVTRSIMLDQVVPNIMIKGYDGLFLDTIDDVAPYTERAHLQPYMLLLIEEIRKRYPYAFIIQNAGLFLLEETQALVDAVLLEDIATNYNFETSSYYLREEEDYRARVDTLDKYQELTNLPFLIIDFAISDSISSKVINRLDGTPYPYFINNIELNDISRGISSGIK